MFKRFLITLTAIALLVGGMVLFTPTHAHAAPAVSCSGTGCNGQFAAATGCNAGDVLKETDTISNRNGTLGTVSLYWSPTCKTNWTHIHNTYALPAVGYVNYCNVGAGQNQAWNSSAVAFDTPMIYAANQPANGYGTIISNGYNYSAGTYCY